MSEEFKNQGGASNSEPNPLARWIISKLFMSRLASPEYQSKQREKAERLRRKSGSRPEITYFHQVDDGYSHLAVQMLKALVVRYDVDVRCYIVESLNDPNNPEPELLSRLAQYDASKIATHYGLGFPELAAPASCAADAHLLQAQSILAALDTTAFINHAASVSEAFWRRDAGALTQLAGSLGSRSAADTRSAVAQGNARRAELGHYSGAMFYYGNEWYWGVDRLYHLEDRLSGLGLDRERGTPPIAPRPAVSFGPHKDNGSLTFEIYPSLRSPYTAIVFDRAVQMAQEVGVTLSVRPVLPMVMRGVPATPTKGRYIMSDCGREARADGVAFGPIYDPIGNPVRRAYSLYPWACNQGKGNALLSTFLRLAFAEGVNTNSEKGLRKVVEGAGLSWTEAQGHLGSDDWKDIVEKNRLAMYQSGLWGVPSFRLLDEAGKEVLALWGQDRLWLFSREIQRILEERVAKGKR